MSAIRCQAIRKVLDDFIARSGWDDYVFIFTKTKDWVEPDSVFVREATDKGLKFLARFVQLNIKYTWMQLSAMKNDMPQIINIADYLKIATDRQAAQLLLDQGWRQGLAWATYGYGGAVGFLVLYSRLEAVPDTMIETTITELSPSVIRFNAWAREEIHELTAYTALSARETECMLLVSEGKKSKQIAGLLGISQRTVEFHIQNAMQKLGGASRSQAASRLVMSTFPQLTNMTALAKGDLSAVNAERSGMGETQGE